MDESEKMDYSAGRNIQGCKKVDSIIMRGRGKKIKVFSSWRYSNGTPWNEAYVYQYVKVW